MPGWPRFNHVASKVNFYDSWPIHEIKPINMKRRKSYVVSLKCLERIKDADLRFHVQAPDVETMNALARIAAGHNDLLLQSSTLFAPSSTLISSISQLQDGIDTVTAANNLLTRRVDDGFVEIWASSAKYERKLLVLKNASEVSTLPQIMSMKFPQAIAYTT